MSSNLYTIFGGNGFVGSGIARVLEARGKTVRRVTRDSWPEAGEHLGTVIFTIGMTADFRKRLVETFELQVLRLHDALTRYSFDSFVYLSSARVYSGSPSTSEDTPLVVRPSDPDHVYNISKLAGESLCVAFGNPKIRIVRLSNVYGVEDTSNLFLTAVMREAVITGSVTIGQAPQSSKDYVWIGDVAEAVVAIAERGTQQTYNVAAGENVTHRMIANILGDAGYAVRFANSGPEVTISPIDTTRFMGEFDLTPTEPCKAIGRVVQQLKNNRAFA